MDVACSWVSFLRYSLDIVADWAFALTLVALLALGLSDGPHSAV